MQKQRLIVQNHEEFTQLVDSSDFRIVRAIVEGALQNINTTKRFIHILTVEVEQFCSWSACNMSNKFNAFDIILFL